MSSTNARGTRRSTYFATEEDPFSHLKVKDGRHAVIDGLNAARHTRTEFPHPVPSELGLLSVEWKSSKNKFLDLPFDPPVSSGLHVLSELGANPSLVKSFLMHWNIHLQDEPIETSGWYAWFDRDFQDDGKNEAAHLALGNVDFLGSSAFRISTNPETQSIVLEAWYTERPWHTTEAPPTEVGIFKSVKQTDAYMLSGRTRRLGKDAKSSPMMLRWYPRHYDSGAKANVSFSSPYGLHPTLEISVDAKPPMPSCRLFTQLELPQALFLDQYELEDLPRMSPRAELIAVWGESDLEKPEWLVNSSSVGLFRLYESSNVTYKIPTHFRYQQPSADQYQNGTVGEPYIYWACDSDESDRKSEFLEPREFIGVESMFPVGRTSFHVWETNGMPYQIPAIDPAAEKHVEFVTVIVVVAGTLSILAAIFWKLWKSPRKLKAQ